MKCMLIVALVVVFLAQNTEAWWSQRVGRTVLDVVRTTGDVVTGDTTRLINHIIPLVTRDVDMDSLMDDGVLTRKELAVSLNLDDDDFNYFDENGDDVLDEQESKRLELVLKHLSV